MPLLAVLLVLLSVATLLLYVLPTAKSRLSGYAEDRAVALADAAAYAAAESEEGRALRRELRLLTDGEGGEVLVVDGEGQVVERVGRERLLSPPSEKLLQQAAEGERINDSIGEQRVAMVPVVREGDLAGGVIFAPGDSEDILYQLFLRSGIEAAVVASVLGGGLALLLATLLSRRVERISRGAREMGKGDFSSRIKPGFDDELGVLARTFNSMAERLEDSFLQLEEKSATLDAILNNLVEGVVVIDLSGNVTFINRSARAMLGIGDDLSGKLPSPFEDFDLPEAVARCAQRRECGEARVRDGEGFLQVRLEHVPAFDEHKGGVLVVIRDLSEGRRLEANQQRFLANAAHELKTPITTILGASELLLTESKDDPEVRRRFLEHILSEANRMQRLSDSLLRLARTGVDMRDPEVVVVDLDGVVREAAERMEPLTESAGVSLRVEGRGGRVLADHEWLEQALLVVLGNAVRFSERGGVIWLRMESGAVVVEDEGSGIGEADLPHVFERFYRGKRSSGGFGLGLAICKDLVERMGGSISLRSKEGIGTRVEIGLPEVGTGAEDTDS